MPGLSPRVRGSRRIGSDGGTYLRSIPASAGQPVQSIATNPEARVYPRECGAARPPPPPRPSYRGLSPRVRGSRRARVQPGADTGSIPASAGQPMTIPPKTSAGAVYPRECGAALLIRINK